MPPRKKIQGTDEAFVITLAVDTSTDSLSISLINEKGILSNYTSHQALRHSASLMPGIEKMLKKAGIRVKDVGLFSVGTGPGSFTGLRVGVTAMRALAIALNRPIVGIPTMDAIAYNGLLYLRKSKLLKTYKKICPVLDAKKSQIYASIYRHDGANIVKETGYLLGPVDRLIRRIKRPVLFLGDAVPLYKDKLSYKKGLKAYFLEGKTWLPMASVIAGMALKKYEKGKTDNPYDLVPLYLYARDCNVRKCKV